MSRSKGAHDVIEVGVDYVHEGEHLGKRETFKARRDLGGRADLRMPDGVVRRFDRSAAVDPGHPGYRFECPRCAFVAVLTVQTLTQHLDEAEQVYRDTGRRVLQRGLDH